MSRKTEAHEETIRVLLADDHTLVRQGIRALLKELDHIQVIAEAGDGREALRQIETCHPDVVLMDIAMPGLNGLEAAAYVAQRFPQVRVIMLSVHANEAYALRAMRAGAVGYLLKDADVTELEAAITAVVQGHMYLSPVVSKHVTQYMRRTGGAPDSPLERIPLRQREILQLIAEGHSTQEIAQTLNISAKTVETHRARLMQRLDIHDVVSLARFAMQNGLVT